MDMTKPITPDQIAEAKLRAIPDFVYKSVNQLLTEKYTGSGTVTLPQKVIVDQILINGPEGLDRHKIFERGWLNFEEVYRAAGWRVNYDRPAYNESYDAFFEFSRK